MRPRSELALAAALALHASRALGDPSPTEAPRVVAGVGIGVTPGLSNENLPNNTGRPDSFYIDAMYRPVARLESLLVLVNYGTGAFNDSGQSLDSASTGFVGAGHWWQLRGGAELRACIDRGRHACGFVDGAAGVVQLQFQASTSMMTQTDFALSARTGIDVGIEHLRFRIAGDFVLPFGPHAPGSPSAVELGVAFAF